MAITAQQRKNMEASVKAIQKRLNDGTELQGDDFALGEITSILNEDKVLECCGEMYGYCTCPPCCAQWLNCDCD